MKHILIVTSYAPSLINFRLSFIKKLLNRGFRVSVASPKNKFTQNRKKILKNLGVNIYIFSLSSVGLSFFKDLKSILAILKIVRYCKPNIVISYTIKPVIYAGLVLNFFKKIVYYPMITGLGYVFINKDFINHKILKIFIIVLYRLSLKSAKKIIFQNKDDQNLFLKLKIIKKKKLSDVVSGSGVDLKEYPISKLPKKPVFLMVARLLVDKGVREYVEAAKIVLSNYPNTIFYLAGYLDKNPSGITADELGSWINEGVITYLGEMKSVQSALKSCRYFVLPSYREGTPRSSLEALSSGRPIITTDAPGCRETVVHKKNGLLVPIKNSVALADAMVTLLREKEKIVKRMAHESYLLAKSKYEINKVNKKMLAIMKL
jgi:glycosyltransferase involved in cell wall biosynthesis